MYTLIMEEYFLFVVSVLILNVVALSSSNKMQYRTDYEYDRKTNAFFKFHIEEAFIQGAKQTCQIEGAELLVPKSQLDIVVAHALFKRYPDLGNQVLVGNDGGKHESAEEEPLINLEPLPEDQPQSFLKLCDLMTRQGNIEETHCYRRLPFICKVEAKDAVYDRQCDVYANGYKYIESAGSCYNIPSVAMTWNKAEAHCRTEGAHLIILNSEAEHQAVATFLQTAPRLRSAKADYYYLAGLRADKFNREFRTIFNQTLPEAGFTTWQDGEPNNFESREYCGALFRKNGKYNDVDCTLRYAFVCEKEVQLKS